MIRVNIAEAKASFSKLLKAAQAGEVVIICDRNREIVELKAFPKATDGPRRLGTDDPNFVIPDAFFEPLTDDELHEWYGGSLPA